MMLKVTAVCSLFLLLLAASGCRNADGPGGKSGPDGGGDDSALISLDGPCSMEDLVGMFGLTHMDSYQERFFFGSLRDAIGGYGAIDEVIVASDSSCRLFYKDPFFCDPVCESGETCATGECTPFPSSLSAGTVQLEGLEQVFTVMPDSELRYTSFEVPSAELGANLNLRAAGGDVEPFVLQGRYVEPFTMPESDIAIAQGEPLTLNWEPGDGEQHIELDLYVAEGNTEILGEVYELYLNCSFPDVGAAEISAVMVESLRSYGPYYYHDLRFRRVTMDSVYIDGGCIEFVVSSEFDSAAFSDETGDFFLWSENMTD